jgi:hypothetical protein
MAAPPPRTGVRPTSALARLHRLNLLPGLGTIVYRKRAAGSFQLLLVFGGIVAFVFDQPIGGIAAIGLAFLLAERSIPHPDWRRRVRRHAKQDDSYGYPGSDFDTLSDSSDGGGGGD